MSLSLKLGGEVGKLDDLASVLSGEGCGRFLILEGEHARRASVKVGLEGLVVFTDGGTVLEAGVNVAIADHKAALWLQWATAEMVRKFGHLHLLRRLLML